MSTRKVVVATAAAAVMSLGTASQASAGAFLLGVPLPAQLAPVVKDTIGAVAGTCVTLQPVLAGTELKNNVCYANPYPTPTTGNTVMVAGVYGTAGVIVQGPGGVSGSSSILVNPPVIPAVLQHQP